MTKNINENIHAPGRNLHLQTHYDEARQKIAADLFDGGRLLAQKHRAINPDQSGESIESFVDKYHSQCMRDIEMIYTISARVKTVRHALSLTTLGKQFLYWNLLDEAVSELELALQYDPRYKEAYLHLTEAFLRRGGLSEAIETANNGIQCGADYPDLWQKLGRAYLEGGQYKKAGQAFQTAVSKNSNYTEALLGMAITRLRIYDPQDDAAEWVINEKALGQIRVIINRILTDKRFDHTSLEAALRFLHGRQFVRTLEQLEVCFNNVPVEPDLHFHDAFYLNFMYGESGRDEDQINTYVERLERLTIQYPKYADLRNKLGIAYLIQCRQLFNKALKQFKHAIQINSNYDRAKRHLKLAQNEGKGFLLLLRAILK